VSTVGESKGALSKASIDSFLFYHSGIDPLDLSCGFTTSSIWPHFVIPT
jgi:hypothetical protein